jgi:dTDP-D-glucose 4,6-dehydratase
VIKKKILVTGGAGFIGSYLVNKLIKNNFDVMVVDNLTCVGGIPFINKKSYNNKYNKPNSYQNNNSNNNNSKYSNNYIDKSRQLDKILVICQLII